MPPIRGHHPLHGLEVEAPAGDVGGAAVGRLGSDWKRALSPCGAVHAIEAVALGFEHRLLRLAFRARDHLVVLGPRLVDHAVALLLGLVDLVP